MRYVTSPFGGRRPGAGIARLAAGYQACREVLEPSLRLLADTLALVAFLRHRPEVTGAGHSVGHAPMSVFSDAEFARLAEGKLGRLATIDPAGMPPVVPLGWRYNPTLDTIDIGCRDFARTAKFRNVGATARVHDAPRGRGPRADGAKQDRD